MSNTIVGLESLRLAIEEMMMSQQTGDLNFLNLRNQLDLEKQEHQKTKTQLSVLQKVHTEAVVEQNGDILNLQRIQKERDAKIQKLETELEMEKEAMERHQFMHENCNEEYRKMKEEVDQKRLEVHMAQMAYRTMLKEYADFKTIAEGQIEEMRRNQKTLEEELEKRNQKIQEQLDRAKKLEDVQKTQPVPSNVADWFNSNGLQYLGHLTKRPSGSVGIKESQEEGRLNLEQENKDRAIMFKKLEDSKQLNAFIAHRTLRRPLASQPSVYSTRPLGISVQIPLAPPTELLYPCSGEMDFERNPELITPASISEYAPMTIGLGTTDSEYIPPVSTSSGMMPSQNSRPVARRLSDYTGIPRTQKGLERDAEMAKKRTELLEKIRLLRK